MQQSFWHVLARVWSSVAFFHPDVQHRGRWWEQQLSRVVPRAEAAAGDPLWSERQTGVLNALLNSLDDDSTCLVSDSEWEKFGAGSAEARVESEPLGDGRILIRVHGVLDHVWPRAGVPNGLRSLLSAIEEAARADSLALILDLRESGGGHQELGEWVRTWDEVRAALLSRLISEPTELPVPARVQRVGYNDPEQPGGAFGAYHTEWASPVGRQVVQPHPGAFRGRLVVLTSARTGSAVEPLLVALQRSGRALCIGERCQRFWGDEWLLPLGHGYALQLRQQGLLYQGAPARYLPDIAADDPLAAALQNLDGNPPRPDREPDPIIPPASVADRSDRIAGMIKLWTAVAAFYPYREQLSQWESALEPAITAAMETEEPTAYYQACQQLLANFRGAHNFVVTPDSRLAWQPRGYVPQVRLCRAGGEVTVLRQIRPRSPVHRGDVLLAIDGEPVAQREARLRLLLAGRPPGAVDHALLPALLDSAKDEPVSMTVRTESGQIHTVTMKAKMTPGQVTEPSAAYTLPHWCPLEAPFEGIGYVDMGRATWHDWHRAMEGLAGCRALIFDLREYPRLHDWEYLAGRFVRQPVSLPPGLRPVLAGPDESVSGWLERRMQRSGTVQPPAEPDTRPIAVLIGGGTISDGEGWVQFFKEASGALLVGTTTAGGFGANAFVRLPGGARASFSGSFHAPWRGRTIEGNGIEPDLWVEPAPDHPGDAVVEAAARRLLGLPD